MDWVQEWEEDTSQIHTEPGVQLTVWHPGQFLGCDWWAMGGMGCGGGGEGRKSSFSFFSKMAPIAVSYL